jgi:MFS family permease
LLTGVAIMIGVIGHERRAADPLLPPSLLGIAELRGANLVAASITASTSPAMLLAMLYVQNVLGLPPGRAALYFPALNLTVIAGSLAGPRLLSRIGPRSSATVGLALVTAGALALTTLPSHGMPVGRLLTSFALMGLGLGIASVASTTTGTGVAPGTERGVASGLLNSAAQIGAAVGLAVIVPLTSPGAEGPARMLDAMRPGFIGAAVIAGLGIAAARTLPRRHADADDRDLAARPMVS